MEVVSVIRYCNQLAVFYLFLQSLPDLRPFLNDLHHVSFPSSATLFPQYFYNVQKCVHGDKAIPIPDTIVCKTSCSQGMAIDIMRGLCVGRQLLVRGVGWVQLLTCCLCGSLQNGQPAMQACAAGRLGLLLVAS